MDDLAVAVSRQNARATTSSRDIFCFSQANNIRNYSVTLMMRDRLQIEKWNEMIQFTIEAGLIEKWSFVRPDKTETDSDVVAHPLKIHHFYGGLLMCFLFLLAAFIAFFLELVIHQKMKSETPHRFWRTADWIIDGQRHMLMMHRANNRKGRERQVPVRKYCDRVPHTRLRRPIGSVKV